LADVLGAIAERIPQDEAARIVPVLLAALKDDHEGRISGTLADSVAAFADHATAADAARAAAILASALTREMRADVDNRLAKALAKFAGRMKADDAAKLCSHAARVLANRLENEENPFPARAIGRMVYNNATPDERPPRAFAILSLTAYMKGAEADQLGREVIRTLLRRLNAPDDSMVLLLPRLDPKTAGALAREFALRLCSENDLAWDGLSAVLTDHGHAPPDPHLIGSRQPLSESLPCRLATQDLVELLKMPTCFGEARRVILHHLSNRYGRRFANHWTFVRFAREQGLGLDFTTPPIRPDPKESLERMLQALDRSDTK
jgi:hypothetical protein